MTISRQEQASGIEAIRVLCDDCPSRFGAAVLFAIHHGYEHPMEPLSEEEKRTAENTAQVHNTLHPKHHTRVLRWKAKG